MTFKVKKLEIYVEKLVFVVVFFSIIPAVRKYLQNYYICFLFILFHELSHVFVASLFGIKTKKLCIRICGLNIIIEQMKIGNVKKFLVFSAGPFSNLILALLFKNIPFIFYTNISLMLINIVPVEPLDGYNILKIILNNLKYKGKVLMLIKKLSLILLTILGVLQLIFLKNPSVIFMTMYIYIVSDRHENIGKNDIYQKYYKNITKF